MDIDIFSDCMRRESFLKDFLIVEYKQLVLILMFTRYPDDT